MDMPVSIEILAEAPPTDFEGFDHVVEFSLSVADSYDRCNTQIAA